jgi:glycosyltransferase involved in cell wall biosynthesis
VVANWADVGTVRPQPAEESLTRKRLGLEGRFVVGYSGNLGRAHEFETLLGAAHLLRDESDIAFLITGGGAKAAALAGRVRREGLGNFVFQDYQPPELLADSLAASDIHLVSLLPELEGLIVPSKIYGILAAGRPAIFIGDRDGELASLVRESHCGIAVQVGDREGLAAALRLLRSDRSRLSSMGKRARELAVFRYSSEHAVTDWATLLAAVAPQVA